MHFLVVATVLLLAAAPIVRARPAPAKRPSAVDHCLEPGPNIAVLNCVSDLADVQDGRLNRSYKAAIA
ncbi:MAG: hypothetical protein H7236_16435 [Gemmatimonadaceae bacterium]|nr:hypothetical protein [Caulobacter sp.]